MKWSCRFIHSFIHSGYLYNAPSRNLLRGTLSPATAKEKCLKKLAEEDTLFRGSKRSVGGSSFQVEGPITEKARRCLSAERALGTKSSPRAEERSAQREARSETGLQRSVKYDGAQPVTDRQICNSSTSSSSRSGSSGLVVVVVITVVEAEHDNQT